MSTDKRIAREVLRALGLTGVMIPAVACGPCLDVAADDTAQGTDDTGDTASGDDTSGSAEDAVAVPQALNASAARAQVLGRGVLPEDVARIIRDRVEGLGDDPD